MFKDKIRAIDIESILKFALAWPIASIMKRQKKDVWLISERPGEARDNGFALYKYIRDNIPDFPVYYVITKSGIDRKKVDELGNVIDFYSFKHYVYYLLAHGHASAHVDAGTPNSRVSNFLETHGLLKNKKVFLQHGVIKDILPFCFYESTRADVFCCQTKAETEFVTNNFGYPKGCVRQLGAARFDKLCTADTAKNQILLMPTWRAWLAPKEFPSLEVARQTFRRSPYYRYYDELISNPKLISFLSEYNLKLFFFVHSDMQTYMDMFSSGSDRIVLANAKEFDVQTLLIDSKLLITDYSSVFFDVAFMNKPTVFYHFDYEEYRHLQHPEGYYDYHNGFGPVFSSAEELVDYLQHLANQDFLMDKQYQEFADSSFDLRDGKNCSRIFETMNTLYDFDN